MAKMWKFVGVVLLVAGMAIVGWLLARPSSAPLVPVAHTLAGVDIGSGPRSIVLLTLDTTRADRLEPYGSRRVETPALARLAEEGIVMERVYAVAPLTLPAHTSILTGLYPPQHGVRNNGIHYVPQEIETLPETLQRHGFATAAFVSASVLEKRYGLDQGFDVYDDDLSSGVARFPRTVPDRPAAATVDSAVAWLDRLEPGRRFFLWVHFYDPHAVYNPPPPFRDRYRDRLYDGEIAYMDSQIARLLEHPRLRSEQRLVVSAIGDHGESLGEHGEGTHGLLAYQATLQVPWILWLGDVTAGVRVAMPVSQVDVAPTLAQLAGVPPPAAAEARSLFAADAAERRVFYSESYLPFYTYGWSKVRLARIWPWELIESSRPELYDLARDPSELSDLYARRPEIVSDMEQGLAALTARFGAGGDLERELEIDHEAMDRLRALGYLAATSTPVRRTERPNPADVIGVHAGLERARVFSRDRLFQQAAAELERVLDTDPGNLAAMIDLAAALEGLGDVEQGVAIAEQALELDPGNQQVLIQLALLERHRGDAARSLELLEAALALDERNPAAWVQIASHHLWRGQSAKVAEALERGLAVAPENATLGALYAFHVESAGDPGAAELRLRTVVERDPFLASGWRFLGALQERGGRSNEAEASYREGLSRTPDDAPLRANLATLLARSSSPEAEAHLREAIRLSTDFPADLRVALGAWLAEQGRLDEAFAEYDSVLEALPGHTVARNNRAVALARTGRAEQAMSELEEVVALAPTYADAHNNLAAIAVFRKQWPLAEKHARRTLELDDGILEAWNNLGVALDEQGRHAEAAESFDRALAIDSMYWRARFNRGLVRRELGRVAEAREDLEAVLSAQPGFVEVYYELGRIYSEGQFADVPQARRLYQAFLRRAPGDPRGDEVRRRLDAIATVPPRREGR
jgi:arylsulfatase A-like enzyme/Tfp pilus assembly protein PilF